MNDHDLFTATIVSHGFDPADASGLLAFIDAPQELVALVRILENFDLVLQEVQNVILYSDPDHPIASHLGSWISICRTVSEHSIELVSVIPRINARPNKQGSPPLRGYFVTNCLYTALWFASSDTLHGKHLICLLAQICIAIETLRTDASGINEDSNNTQYLSLIHI